MRWAARIAAALLAASASASASAPVPAAAQEAGGAESPAGGTDYLALVIAEGPGWWPVLFLLLVALLAWRRPEVFGGLKKFSGFGVEIEREVRLVESEVGRVEDEGLAMLERIQALEAQVAALKAAGTPGDGTGAAPGAAEDPFRDDPHFGGAAPGGRPVTGRAAPGTRSESARGRIASRAPRVHLSYEDEEAAPPDPAPFDDAAPALRPPAPSAPGPASPAPQSPAPHRAPRPDAPPPGSSAAAGSSDPAGGGPDAALRDLLDAALSHDRFVWRSIDRLALETGRPKAEIHRILAADPAYALGKGVSGKVIARLASRAPPPPRART